MSRRHPTFAAPHGITSTRAARRAGQTLIGLLVVVVIMIGLYLTFLGPRRGKDGERRPSVARQSIDRAKEVELNSNISQIQQIIGMYKNDNEGKPPASLDELKSYSKFPAEMFVNPVDGKPLVYDATTGAIAPQPEGVAPQAPAPGAPAPGAPASQAPVAPNAGGATGPGGVRIPDLQPQVPADEATTE